MAELLFGEGVMSKLGAEIAGYPDPVLVVSGASSYEASGAGDQVGSALEGRRWQRVVVEHDRPGKESATAAFEAVTRIAPRTVIAVGGGAVIDTAKLLSLSVMNGGVEAVLNKKATELEAGLGIVAIPTTAGSGSERTPFAVAYVDSIKRSVEHESIRPLLAIVDPVLTHSLTRAVTISSGFDAFSHALESLWSVKSTPESVDLSRRALRLAWDTLTVVADDPTPQSRRVMAEASTLAGAAIATARTTASHALSYHLSVTFGVPHGLAVALTLGPLLEFNAAVRHDSIAHPGGVEQVRRFVTEICEAMGVAVPEEARAALLGKMASLGAPTSLSDIGLTSAEQISSMIESVNEERLANNPRRISATDLQGILEGIR
jgi:alcohol dehydrogenase class IV